MQAYLFSRKASQCNQSISIDFGLVVQRSLSLWITCSIAYLIDWKPNLPLWSHLFTFGRYHKDAINIVAVASASKNLSVRMPNPRR